MEYLVGYLLVSWLVTPVIARCCGMNKLHEDEHLCHPDLPYNKIDEDAK